MFVKKTLFVVTVFLAFSFAFLVPAAKADTPGEYKAIVTHLKTKYRAKKVRIPFMWLAKVAVRVVKPAGVKSFSVTLFEDLKFSSQTVDREMQEALKQSFTAEWSSIFRTRSRDGQQAYMYMREAGKNVKITLVTIDKNQAAVIRATFSPEKLAEFINDPRIFGVSLGDSDSRSDGRQSKEIESQTGSETN